MTTRSFSDLVLELGHATAEEVAHAEQTQRRLAREGQRVFLAEILVTGGVISPAQRRSLLERGHGYHESREPECAALCFGDLAIRKGYVSPTELFSALVLQRDEDMGRGAHRLVGDILVDREQLSEWGLSDVLASMSAASALPTPRLATRPKSAWDCVGEVMSPVVWTAPDALLGQVLDDLTESGLSVALVLGRGRLRGIVDLWEVREIERTIHVACVMSAFEPTVSRETSLSVVTKIFVESGRASLAVVTRGEAIGGLTRDDLRRAGISALELGETPTPDEELGVVD